MTRHIRWGLILFMGILIAIAGTTPRWLELLEPLQEEDSTAQTFPCPAGFEAEVCQLLETINEENPLEAQAMIAALQADPVPAPANEATCQSIEDVVNVDTVSDFNNTLIRIGQFSEIDRLHSASGTVRVLELVADAEISRYLCFEEGFTLAKGPDLRVYFSVNPQPHTAEEVLGAETAVEISLIKGNVGGQYYKLDNGIDITQYASVVIMSAEFGRVFSIAQLTLPIQ